MCFFYPLFYQEFIYTYDYKKFMKGKIMYQYKVVTFHLQMLPYHTNGSKLASLTLGTDEIQTLINSESKEGWRLHSMNTMNFSVILITFEKQVN